jgi:hypothetical protein
MQSRCAYLEICYFPGLRADLVLRRFAFSFLFVEVQERIVQRILEFVRAGLFLVQLLVEVAIVAGQEALADLQLPDFFVLDNDVNGMLAACEAQLQACAAQRVLELAEVGVSVCVQRRNKTPTRVPLDSTGRALTHIFDLITMIYI